MLLIQTIIGGFSMNPELAAQLVHIFPRVVSSVLRSVLLSSTVRGGGAGGTEGSYNGSDYTDESNNLVNTLKAPLATLGNHQIVQWSRGVKIVRDRLLHAELQLAEDGQSMTIVCWGPDDRRRELFFFQVRRSIGVSFTSQPTSS